jgi:hypothetical protein
MNAEQEKTSRIIPNAAQRLVIQLHGRQQEKTVTAKKEAENKRQSISTNRAEQNRTMI